MSRGDAGDPRAEAERLVAAALAAASMAARGMGHLATGSGECCVCPVCRGIAALREPSPEFSERLASAAGDLAEGVASVLRAFGTATCGTAAPAAAASAGGGDPTASEDRACEDCASRDGASEDRASGVSEAGDAGASGVGDTQAEGQA